jgi:transposase
MPVRPFSRDQYWLLPPRLDELIPSDHRVRFVAVFIESLADSAWAAMGIESEGEPQGAPSYHPAALLSAWVYGFMTRVRSSRRLEAACREQVPFMWLTGNQKPDHNTLWRFYKEHREGMRELLKLSVETAVTAGLVDFALQAVDGTRLAGNVSPDKTYSKQDLERLLRRAEAAIKDLEDQNSTEGERPPGQLPPGLENAEELRSKVRQALEEMEAEGRNYINLTDHDAALLRVEGGFLTGYNAQAMASPLLVTGGQLVTAVDVVNELDAGQLLPMIEQAQTNLGQAAEATLADAGYSSGSNLAACEEQGLLVLMPDSQRKARQSAYHKDAFEYDPETDSYTCPEGQVLHFQGTMQRNGKLVRRYRAASAPACRHCPAFGICTTNARHGRYLSVNPEDPHLRRARQLMETEQAKELYKRRKSLIEPVFAIIKEHLGVRRLLLRGLANVRAEWSLLAVAFNLRALARAFLPA